MRGARLSAPDARDYERIRQEIAQIKAENQRLMDQNTQANDEILRYRRIINDLEKSLPQNVEN